MRRARATPSGRRTLVVLVVADALALSPRVRLEIQIVLVAEGISISWAEVRDDRVVDVLGMSHVQGRRSTSVAATLYVSAHTLIHLVPWLNVELSQVAFVGRFKPAIVLSILLHILSSALRLDLGGRELRLDWLLIVF